MANHSSTFGSTIGMPVDGTQTKEEVRFHQSIGAKYSEIKQPNRQTMKQAGRQLKAGI